jgi:hypothetical protein
MPARTLCFIAVDFGACTFLSITVNVAKGNVIQVEEHSLWVFCLAPRLLMLYTKLSLVSDGGVTLGAHEQS